MVDAAVAIEAIDGNAPLNPDMYNPDMTNYESRLWRVSGTTSGRRMMLAAR